MPKKFFLLLVLLTNFAHAKFTDLTPNYPYYDAIQNLKVAEILRGYDDASFRAEAPINRAEFLKVVVKAFPEKFEPCQNNQLPFTDVFPEHWFFSFVCQATQAGIVQGYADQGFHPGKFLNVAEAAKILSLVAELPDFPSEPWFQTYLQNLEFQHALLPSFDTPSDLINRGEVAEIVERISKNIRNRSFSAYDTNTRTFIPQVREELYFYPQKLSLPALKNQKLIGTEFKVEKKVFENSLYTKHNISYKSNRNKISGLMLLPKTCESDGCPLLILNHGYYPTDIYRRGGGMKREQDYFVRQGFIVLHSDYRGHADSDPNPEDRKMYDGALGYTMDVYNLIQAYKKYKPSTSQKTFMLGHSMGGAITQNIITLWPDLVDRAVVYASSGGNAWNNYQRWWSKRSESNQSKTSWLTPNQNPWSWEQLSPENFYEHIQTPLLIFHGKRDGYTSIGVPLWWSDRMVERLESVGKDFDHIQYPTQGHIFVGSDWEDFVIRSKNFFQDQD